MKKSLFCFCLFFSALGIAANCEITDKKISDSTATWDVDAERFLRAWRQSGQGDYVQAKKWLENNANLGDGLAQYTLGVLYAKGLGSRQDYFQAKVWFEKAAALEYASAQYSLGMMYAEGVGVEQDVGKAKELFNRACDFGSERGCASYRALKECGL